MGISGGWVAQVGQESRSGSKSGRFGLIWPGRLLIHYHDSVTLSVGDEGGHRDARGRQKSKNYM